MKTIPTFSLLSHHLLRIIWAALLVLLPPKHLCGQTAIDLPSQAKNVDFSAASVTRPIKTGTTLPAQCTSGDFFFRTNVAAGANLYACTATNNWSVMGSVAHSHTAGGDATGDLASLSIVRLQNRNVSTTAPGAGQVLAWNASAAQWEPQAPSGGGSGGGASSGSQLTDLVAARATSTTLTIGAQCSASAPCNVRFGNTVYSFTAAASVQISSGTGTAFVYVTRSGTLTVGHNLSVTCTGCVLEAATDFPADAVPLYRWTASSGTWDSNGGTDMRAFLSTRAIAAGNGVTIAEASGQVTIGIDPAVIANRVEVPASSATGCTSGGWAADTSYYYVCVADNTWRRLALSTW